MLRPASIRPLTPRHVPGLMLLVLAVLWAQMLGLAHGVRHAAPASHVASVHVVAVASDLLGHLQSPTGDEAQCRVYDQLGQGSPLAWGPDLAAEAFPLRPAQADPSSAPARVCAVFAARAPPG